MAGPTLDQLRDRSEAAWNLAESGDFRQLIQLLPALRNDAREMPRVYERLFSISLEFLLVGQEPRVEAHEVHQLLSEVDGGSFAKNLLFRAVMLGCLRAWLDFDGKRLEEWLPLVEPEAASVARAHWEFCHSLKLVLESQPQEALQRCRRAAQIATDHREAGTLVMSTALEAAALISVDSCEAALARARLASRMARTEGLLIPEYFANIVLARARRHVGMPYLASRILDALKEATPAPWHDWIGWERILATGKSTPSGSPAIQTIGALMVRGLADLSQACVAGNEGRFQHCANTLQHVARRAPLLWSDAAGLAAAHHPRWPVQSDTAVTPAVRRWCAGAAPKLPFTAPVERDGSTERGGLAFALGGPGMPARRLLRGGLSLLDHRQIPTLPKSGRPQPRVHGVLAALALAEARRLEEVHLFREIWGFPFVREKHLGVLKNVVHRARSDLGSTGQIARESGQVLLTLNLPVAIADPRCDRSLREHILRMLASRKGVGSSRALAEDLGVSPRLIQQALRDLLEEGACVSERDGREIRYRLEDTTFCKPTLDRLRIRH